MNNDYRVLLIQPHSPRINFTLPLGLAYIAAIIKKRALEVKIIDATAPYSHGGMKYIIREVSKFRPKFVGLSLNTLFIGLAYDLINELKKLDITIFAGGPHVSLFPHEVLAHGVDIAIRGEAEDTMEELVSFFLGVSSLKTIKGTSFYDENGNIVDNPDRAFIDNLDKLPFPDKEAFDINVYAKNDFELWRFGGLITSRGCVGRCSFCSKQIFGNKYRSRSIDNVLEEITFLNKRYGLKNFYFIDDIFTADKKRIYSLCDKLKEKLNFRIGFSCITRFDHIDRELLMKLKWAGCTAINYGVESANPTTLEKLNKLETIDEMEEKIRLTNEIGINCSINFMWGYPWEGETEIDNTVNLMRKLSHNVSEIMPGGILIPFPGTELYEKNKEKYNLTGWWLDRGRFTGTYRSDSRVTLFRHYLFDDQGQFEGGGFFKISEKLLRRIKQAALFIGWQNLRKRHNLFASLGIFTICEISNFIYMINHNLGYFFSSFILYLIYLKNIIGKKKVLLSLIK